MAPFGYHRVQQTPGVWVHDNRNTIFSFVIDVFCVQYSSMEDAKHFLNDLREKYLITVDNVAAVYIWIKLDWDYVHRTVTLSIPNYMRKALQIFQHIMMGCKEYSPHICSPIQYVQKIQYADPLYAAEYLSDK